MPQLIERGFHNQCVIGTFTAAAVTGKLLGLSEEQLVHGFGIAASHSSGTNEYDQGGGAVKRMHAGLGARGGMQAALLAQKGLTAPRSIFESPRGGVFHTFVDFAREEKIDTNLGTEFIFPKVMSMKLWPTLGGLHSSIEGFGTLLDRERFKADEVKAVKVGVQPYTLKHGAGIILPSDVVSAQFSMAFSLALRMIHGRNDLELYMEPQPVDGPGDCRLRAQGRGLCRSGGRGRIRPRQPHHGGIAERRQVRGASAVSQRHRRASGLSRRTRAKIPRHGRSRSRSLPHRRRRQPGRPAGDPGRCRPPRRHAAPVRASSVRGRPLRIAIAPPWPAAGSRHRPCCARRSSAMMAQMDTRQGPRTVGNGCERRYRDQELCDADERREIRRRRHRARPPVQGAPSRSFRL